jgi:hypothetical protein
VYVGDDVESQRPDAVQRFLATMDTTASELQTDINSGAYIELQRISRATVGGVPLSDRTFRVNARPTGPFIDLMRGLGYLVVQRWEGFMEDPGMEPLVAALRAFIYTISGEAVDAYDPLTIGRSRPAEGRPRRR